MSEFQYVSDEAKATLFTVYGHERAIGIKQTLRGTGIALRTRAEIEALEADARRWRHFRQLVRDDPVRAQAMVWNADKSRTKFTYACDQSIAFARRASNKAAMKEQSNGQG